MAIAKMRTKYLLHFAHEHIPFRWTEFLALASRNGCRFRLLSDVDHILTRPFILVELTEGSSEETLVKSARGSYLLKDLYELWAQSPSSLEDLASKAASSKQFLSRRYHGFDQAFRVNCESFGSKLSQLTKVEMIKKMTFLEDFDAKPNLVNPQQTYCIFEMNDRTKLDKLCKEYYFGRHLAKSDRAQIFKFSLKERKFIANTSMDPMLSLVSANAAKVKPNDLVYDPFVGSGSLLVAAAYKGAYVMGGDIDWKLLHGQSRPSRKGQRMRDQGESVRANLCQYGLDDRYIDVMISDITRSPLVLDLRFDAIISDPPYGVRECSEKIGTKARERKPLEDGKIRYPSKVSYQMPDLLTDLLDLSAKHLTIGGRLIYYLPIIKETDCALESLIPRHPCLNVISHCEQGLSAKVSRLMIVMEKTREPAIDDVCEIPKMISDMNLRDTYFSKGETTLDIKIKPSPNA